MRCIACNEELTDQEAIRRDEHGGFLDLCNECAEYTERYIKEEEPDEDYIEDGYISS